MLDEVGDFWPKRIVLLEIASLTMGMKVPYMMESCVRSCTQGTTVLFDIGAIEKLRRRTPDPSLEQKLPRASEVLHTICQQKTG
jgi:hypothetical protein